MNSKKIALITGASAGIGKALAQELVNRGWTVVGVARSEDKLQSLQRELGNDFLPFVCDVSSRDEIEKTSRSLLEQGIHPNLFFLNAGIAGEGALENSDSFDLAVHERIMAVNYFGVLSWVEFWEKPCQRNGGANFIVTSSVNALFAPPAASGYSASKAAIAKAFEGSLLPISFF